MKPSRIVAVLLVVGGVGWIGSGVLGRGNPQAPPPNEAAPERVAPRFRVATLTVTPEMHRRRIILSGRTEADKRVWAVARVSGVVEKLNVRRGSVVKAGEVIAVLSDE